MSQTRLDEIEELSFKDENLSDVDKNQEDELDQRSESPEDPEFVDPTKEEALEITSQIEDKDDADIVKECEKLMQMIDEE